MTEQDIVRKDKGPHIEAGQLRTIGGTESQEQAEQRYTGSHC